MGLGFLSLGSELAATLRVYSLRRQPPAAAIMVVCARTPLLALLALLALLLGAAAAQPQQTCYPLPSASPPSAAELPLCGNGALDPGEVCDDGNRIGGDGCNAWCSQFDLLTKACTLAGQPAAPCPQGGAVASTPAQSIFCELTAVAASPDGTHVLLADGGAILRMDLFVASRPLVRFPATLSAAYTRFCALHILPDGGVVAHECAQQRVLLFTPDGAGVRQLAVLDALAPVVASSAAPRAYYDAAAGALIVAGLAAAPSSCALLYSVGVVSSAQQGARLIADVPCVAYNVWEGGTVYTSFALDGMIPQAVDRGPCLAHMGPSVCYSVLMRRADMHLLTVFVPEGGGDDLAFQVSTDASTNVLGAPLQAHGLGASYTLRGSCLTAQSSFAAPRSGRSPPPVTLGNACNRVAEYQGWGCATPLNTPFNTDVHSSPYLLPDGLTSRHTHAELVAIFETPLPGVAAGTQLEGMPLYAQIMANVIGETAPIAMVELPRSRDVLYITSRSVGLVTTKGVVLQDAFNPGYCIATDIIQCPPGQFGSVGGRCSPCSHADAGAHPSVAEQVQCLGAPASNGTGGRRRLLAAAQSPAYLQFTSVVSAEVLQGPVDAALAYYMLAKGLPCPAAGSTAMTPQTPFNMAADAALGGAGQTTGQMAALITAAEARTGLILGKSTRAEYAVDWSAQDTALLLAASRPGMVPLNDTYLLQQACPGMRGVAHPNGTLDGMHAALSSSCAMIINVGLLERWLPCALRALQAWASSAPRRRRLLLSADPLPTPVFVEQAGVTLFSATVVAYDGRVAAPPAPAPPPRPAPAPSSSLLLIVGAIAGVVALVAIVALACVLHRPSRQRPAGPAYSKLL